MFHVICAVAAILFVVAILHDRGETTHRQSTTTCNYFCDRDVYEAVRK